MLRPQLGWEGHQQQQQLLALSWCHPSPAILSRGFQSFSGSWGGSLDQFQERTQSQAGEGMGWMLGNIFHQKNNEGFSTRLVCPPSSTGRECGCGWTAQGPSECLDECWNTEWGGEGFSSCSSCMDKLELEFAYLELSQAPTFPPQSPVIS